MFNLRNPSRLATATGLIICALLLGSVYPSYGTAQSLLGTAESFAVLGGSTVTNTGPTTVQRNLGVSPGSAVTGFPPGVVTGGSIHVNDAVASQAQSDVTTAYNSLAGRACDVDLTGQDLGGLTLLPGVYCFSSSAQLTGTLTLDALGNSSSLFIFQIGTTLTTASNSSVLTIGGSPCNVFWQVGSSATLGTTTRFQGNILALASITLNTSARITGRALARNGAVTMDTNNVSAAGCAAAPEVPTATPVTPAPATATPVTPVAPGTATSTPVVPGPAPQTPTAVVPGPSTETPVSPGTTTPTPIVSVPQPPAPIPGTPTLPTDATPTPTAPMMTPGAAVTPASGTSTPTTATPATSVTATPGTTVPTTPTPATPVGPGTATPVRPGTVTPVTPTPAGSATSTPTPTRTPVTIVRFPDTGSGGSSIQNDQPVAFGNIAIGIAIVMLLAGGFGIAVDRRRRS